MFGHYELQERIGRGGMGEVYRAFDHEHRRLVALKLLLRELAGDHEFVERFRRESYAAARLRDPHVIPIHRFGEIDGRLYIDMQLVDGHDLAHVLRSGALDPRRAVHILGQAAQALHAAHAEGLVHRDVKPSNLLVAEDKNDFVYLVDFGIAQVAGGTAGRSLTATGSTVGTFAYMAPERLAGSGGIDGRADVYSLACVLYEMLTGRRPFPFDDLPAVITAHLHAPPPAVTSLRPDLSPGWDEVIARGMAKHPATRYGTPRELAAEAARVASHSAPSTAATTVVRHGPARTFAETAPAPPPLPLPTNRPRRTARTAWLVTAVLVAAAALLGGVVLLGPFLIGLVNAGTPQAASTSEASTAAAGPTTDEPPQATAESSTVTVAPSTPAEPAPGDLGLSVPISTPDCDGSFAVFVAAATEPDAYHSEVESYLAQFPDSSYLLTEGSCASLRPRTDSGDQIYAIFYGPYSQLEDACATLGQVGGDSYVRRLDDVSPVGELIEC